MISLMACALYLVSCMQAGGFTIFQAPQNSPKTW